MSWKTDWLYQLIFREVDQIWQRAAQDSRTSSGPAPDYLLVSQFADVSVRPYREICPDAEVKPSMLHANFVKPMIKQWKFDDSGVQADSEATTHLRKTSSVRGMFYQVGTVNFGICADRKLVFLRHHIGPRYGQDRVFRVYGQGRQGALTMHEDFLWTIY